MHPDTGDITARIRAARGYANMTQPELADAIGMSLPTFKRAELGRRPVATEELLTIARVCGVPPQFLLTGWMPVRAERHRLDPNDLRGRLDIIDSRIDEWERTIARLIEVIEPVLQGRAVEFRESAN